VPRFQPSSSLRAPSRLTTTSRFTWSLGSCITSQRPCMLTRALIPLRLQPETPLFSNSNFAPSSTRVFRFPSSPLFSSAQPSSREILPGCLHAHHHGVYGSPIFCTSNRDLPPQRVRSQRMDKPRSAWTPCPESQSPTHHRDPCRMGH